jgi:DNA-binding NtrC family response regulator
MTVSPHPGPLPGGEGDAERAAREFHRKLVLTTAPPDHKPPIRMHKPFALDQISFLQSFIVHAIRAAEQHCFKDEQEKRSYIEHLGLASSHCLEAAARQHLSLEGAIDADAYTDVILDIKNSIGGAFSRELGEAGAIRVSNQRCPFGSMVTQAPELCRMTASVFGAIAARNFGYAKVELCKRIATGDATCEVCVYTDRSLAEGKHGDEYECTGDLIVSRSASAEITARVESKLASSWCPPRGRGKETRGSKRTIVAESAAMKAALEAVEVVAPTPATVLITGETGVGKEVIARAIHALSRRSDRELIAVNCGAVPEGLIESALFGHEKGAFTDAHTAHAGFFERADGGTLFLDEIDSLPIAAQARLLRVLQEGEFERVGGRQHLTTDVRIIAATNQDIQERVAAGAFRRDLYYRINVVPIRIPPLRERRSDLSALVNYILRNLAERYEQPRKGLSEHAWKQVLAYPWPGNVRELENVLEHAFLFCKGRLVEDLPLEVQLEGDVPRHREAIPLRQIKRDALQKAELAAMEEALARFHGNVSAIARAMGITPRAVHMKLRTYRLKAEAYRR